MKYQPSPLPFNPTPQEIIEYLGRELEQIAQSFDHPETTQLHYGREVVNTAASAVSTLTIDWRAGQKQRVEFNNSATAVLTFSPPEGVCNLMLRALHQGAGRKFTLPATVKWHNGTVPTWSVSASAVDVMAMYYDGTSYHATASLDSK